MVGRDVGQDARVVRLVADAAQDDPAARRLEHGDVDVAPGQDLLGAARPGPVARLDHPLVDEDAVRRGRPDVAARPRSRMWVISRVDGASCRWCPVIDTIGIAPVGVADPGRRRRPGRRRSARVQRASSRSWAPVSWAVRDGDTSRSARASAASAIVRARSAPDPREGDDPVARVGRAVDRQAAAALAVVGPQPPDPGGERGDRRRASRAPGRAAPSWTSAWRPGSRWPYQVRRRPMATSSLTAGSSR